MERYMLVFGDIQEVVTASQLQNFVKVAVCNNKDISHFEVHRIVDVYVSDDGKPFYEFA